MNNSVTRRHFLKTASVAGAAISAVGFPNFVKADSGKTLVAGIVGVRSRGLQLARDMQPVDNITVGYLCDVDEEYLNKAVDEIGKLQQKKPVGFKDLRKMFEQKDLDVVFIATPDHWHAPAAILALEAGKHVYVEKPCCHNPREGEMLVAAQLKYGGKVQMGTQRRSSPEWIDAVAAIQGGIVGRAYYGKSWYANERGSIGTGKVVPVKAGLDWDLWQGPAPRTPYRDNIHPYNWHWFWRWGTGEIGNNATHHLDILRWALEVDYPKRVNSTGGRYQFEDDWEFYDTQLASYEFEGRKAISWEGRSCNNMLIEGHSTGIVVYGTTGAVVVSDGDFRVYDPEHKLVKKIEAGETHKSSDLVGGGSMTQMHIANLRDAIQKGMPLHSPIEDAAKSVLLIHLGNIAQKTEKSIKCNTKDGHVVEDLDAMAMWNRQYEPGWEPKV